MFGNVIFQGQNYGMNKEILAMEGMLNALDKILLIVLFVMCVGIAYLIALYKKADKSEKKMKKTTIKIQEELDNAISERDVLMGEHRALMEKYDAVKKKKDRLHKMAYSDSLTDLPNKVALYEVIESAYATLRKEEKFILMHIDLDNFKIVNDTLGHAYGDELILDVSHRIKEALDDIKVIGRSELVDKRSIR